MHCLYPGVFEIGYNLRDACVGSLLDQDKVTNRLYETDIAFRRRVCAITSAPRVYDLETNYFSKRT